MMKQGRSVNGRRGLCFSYQEDQRRLRHIDGEIDAPYNIDVCVGVCRTYSNVKTPYRAGGEMKDTFIYSTEVMFSY